MQKITAYVIAYNEAEKIADAGLEHPGGGRGNRR
jgi:hypothetical protein